MKDYLSLIKFSHTIFALPFALVGYFIGAQHVTPFNLKVLILVLLCMVFARNAAMAFNRYLDRDIDKANPRTANREIPAGKISDKNALNFVIINSLGLIITCYFINSLVLYLSPIALFITLGYSYTKRFTSMSHLVLGIGLALAPVGAYLSIVGHFDIIPILLGVTVMFWVAGFDIIYAMQDIDFDQSAGLNSTPVALGKVNSMYLSIFFHVISAMTLLAASYLLYSNYESLGLILWIGSAIFIVLLAYQHFIVGPNNLERVNLAFFTTNGISSVLFGLCLIIDFYI